MPMFATLLARDIRASLSWCTAGLGFIDLFTMPPRLADMAFSGHLHQWSSQQGP
jgi:hypothetical protein